MGHWHASPMVCIACIFPLDDPCVHRVCIAKPRRPHVATLVNIIYDLFPPRRWKRNDYFPPEWENLWEKTEEGREEGNTAGDNHLFPPWHSAFMSSLKIYTGGLPRLVTVRNTWNPEPFSLHPAYLLKGLPLVPFQSMRGFSACLDNTFCIGRKTIIVVSSLSPESRGKQGACFWISDIPGIRRRGGRKVGKQEKISLDQGFPFHQTLILPIDLILQIHLNFSSFPLSPVSLPIFCFVEIDEGYRIPHLFRKGSWEGALRECHEAVGIFNSTERERKGEEGF